MYRKLTLLILAYVAITVVKCDDSTFQPGLVDILSKDISTSRTFGHNALKRLSFIFLPVMFTLGVISTLLMALAVISVKNLAIGVILLIVGVSQAVSRLFAAVPAVPAPLRVLPAPIAPWPASAPVLSPWGRSDNDAVIPE